MKTLTNSQQQDLQELLEQIDVSMDPRLQNRVRYWRLELKPKRVRKKPVYISEEMEVSCTYIPVDETVQTY